MTPRGSDRRHIFLSKYLHMANSLSSMLMQTSCLKRHFPLYSGNLRLIVIRDSIKKTKYQHANPAFKAAFRYRAKNYNLSIQPNLRNILQHTSFKMYYCGHKSLYLGKRNDMKHKANMMTHRHVSYKMATVGISAGVKYQNSVSSTACSPIIETHLNHKMTEITLHC